MRKQEQFLDYLGVISKIIMPLNISDSGLSDLEQQIKTTELIIPVAGNFSAGKSSLINSFLGNEILPTALTPKTALATELHYGCEDYIAATDNSNTVEKYALSDFANLNDNAKNFKSLRVYLNNSQLKSIYPLILVDMPGFDAPIESHNQAIFNYLNHGVYFIFLTSVEDGNITTNIKHEIENIQRFSKGFSFCISKTNLRSKGDVNKIQEKISDQLQDFFDYNNEVLLLDQNGGENLKKILSNINPENLFSLLFK